ncbi:MAG: methyltransferase domain-containing protein [Thermomicrobiales bacterium]
MSTAITSPQAQYRQLVRDEWIDDTTVESWEKWHGKMTIQLQALTDALLEAARVRPGLRVLDLASGTGQPSLDLARAVGATGHVTATDLSPAMLATAERNAGEAGLANIAFRQVDAEALPFPDESFDVVTSRLGAMYFVDFQRALAEIRRVLKPGGRVAFAVWGPGDQGTYVAGMIGPFLQRVSLPKFPPEAPTPFRFAAPGALGGALGQAGFRQVDERSLIIPAPWPGTPEEYWQQFYDVAVPMRPLFDSLPPDEFTRAKAEAADLLRAQYDGTTVHATVATVVASGTR